MRIMPFVEVSPEGTTWLLSIPVNREGMLMHPIAESVRLSFPLLFSCPLQESSRKDIIQAMHLVIYKIK
jgi:hypothetical protein